MHLYYRFLSTPLDAVWHSAGEPFTEHGPVNSSSVDAAVHVLPGSRFQRDGQLVAYQFYAVTAGLIEFLVSSHCDNSVVECGVVYVSL